MNTESNQEHQIHTFPSRLLFPGIHPERPLELHTNVYVHGVQSSTVTIAAMSNRQGLLTKEYCATRKHHGMENALVKSKCFEVNQT